MHGFTDRHIDEIRALIKFATSLATWLGTLSAYVADRGWRDTCDLPSGGDGRARQAATARTRPPATLAGTLAMAVDQSDLEQTDLASSLGGHRLLLAASQLGPVLLCRLCGGYARSRLNLLKDDCRGRPTSNGAKYRVNKFLAGWHPTKAGVRLGSAWGPPLAVSNWLVQRWAGRGLKRLAGAGAGAGAMPAEEYRAAVLHAYGLTEAHLDALIE